LRAVVLRSRRVRGVIAPEARGAWGELEARLRPYVARRVPAPSDVDDVVQEVFVRMHRGVEGLRDGERFGGWVYRIARARLHAAAAGRGARRLSGGRRKLVYATDT
jgi:RNA polymerase sigma-70 factor, ECF subfamily